MKEPKRLLSHGATDFERQLLRAVSSERPSALLRSRMQRSLGLVGPLAWASNVKAMFGSVGTKATLGMAALGVVVAGGVAGYPLLSTSEGDDMLRDSPSVAIEAAPEPADAEDAPVVQHGSNEQPAAPSRVAPSRVASSRVASSPVVSSPAAPARANAPAAVEDLEDGRLREEIALLDGVKAALQRGEREQARQGLDTYRERFRDGILRREANVLRRRAEAKSGRASEGAED